MDRHQDDDQRNRRRFRIWVDGRLGEGFADGLNAELEQHHTAEGTTLAGELVDQAHLHGILDHLHRLGLEVLRFETYRPDDRSPGADMTEP